MKWETVTINGQEVSVAFDENSIHIYNAYPIKDDLKVRGYRWNSGDKSWFIKPGDVPEELEVLKNNLQSILQLPKKSTVKKGTGKGSTGKELAKFPDSCSVTDLRNRIDRLIREGIRGNVWVRGVIASDVKNYKWASYLDLKDEDEKRDMFFRVEVKKQNLNKINRKLSESGVAQGLEKDLPVFCNVEVHLPLRNVVDVRLTLVDILPEYTQSKIRNQREITLEKLKEEGVLENQKKMILPTYISRVGIITSQQGTSLKDIKAGLHPYEGKYDIYFVDSRMEGANAVDSIIRAIDFLEKHSKIPLDAVIVARGGGSEQSLAVFNDLRLCRKVCETPIPVLTAIGHEKDVSAIEQCSWHTPTPSTPSGIGKYLQQRYVNLQEQLSGTIAGLIHHFTNVRQREMEKLNSYLRNIPARVSTGIKFREERFNAITRELERAVSFTVKDQERRIGTLTNQLLERSGTLCLKNRNSIENLTTALRTRAETLNRRELKGIEKTILKLDFEKRHRDNRRMVEELGKKSMDLLSRAETNILIANKDLENLTRLVQAGDPQQILKKGFTLTLDEENRIIKTVDEFNQKKKATLKFYDGSTEIVKETLLESNVEE
ncbi:MAG: exodeoxyribonuclease VII large subunit [bacterium]|nr:exodeoxyribonuclease VII large subunit [bacterium]